VDVVDVRVGAAVGLPALVALVALPDLGVPDDVHDAQPASHGRGCRTRPGPSASRAGLTAAAARRGSRPSTFQSQARPSLCSLAPRTEQVRTMPALRVSGRCSSRGRGRRSRRAGRSPRSRLALEGREGLDVVPGDRRRSAEAAWRAGPGRRPAPLPGRRRSAQRRTALRACAPSRQRQSHRRSGSGSRLGGRGSSSAQVRSFAAGVDGLMGSVRACGAVRGAPPPSTGDRRKCTCSTDFVVQL
jgi:hypothetical protein